MSTQQERRADRSVERDRASRRHLDAPFVGAPRHAIDATPLPTICLNDRTPETRRARSVGQRRTYPLNWRSEHERRSTGRLITYVGARR